MTAGIARTVFSIVETLLGVAMILLGTIQYWQSLDCPESVGGECGGWGLLAVVILLIPGVIVAAAGAFSYFLAKMRLWKVQAVFGIILAAYSVWLVWLP